MLRTIEERLKEYKEAIFEDLSKLIKIQSVYDGKTKSEGSPFGQGVRECFDYIMHMAKREGLYVKDFDGYALHIDYGKSDDIFGILCHGDIVGIFEPEKWLTNPFQLEEKNGLWLGRGVNDNKGMIVGLLYVMKILKELGFKSKKKIRLIIGGAEETTWECMEHYFKHNPMPSMGFSPDGDFPIINCEKGISYFQYTKELNWDNASPCQIVSIHTQVDWGKVCSEMTVRLKTPDMPIDQIIDSAKIIPWDEGVDIYYEGVSAKSRNPHRGENAIFKGVKSLMKLNQLDPQSKEILDLLNQCFVDSTGGEKLGIYHKDTKTGCTTSNLSHVILKASKLIIGFDYRYPNGVDYEHIKQILGTIARENQLSLRIYQERPLHYVPADNPLIMILQRAYEKIRQEECELLTKGAASYGRTLTNGVAFGPTFPPFQTHSHGPNESMNIQDFFLALRIYAQVLITI